MKKVCEATLVLLVLALSIFFPLGRASSDLSLVSDHFDGDSLDLTKWVILDDADNTGYPAYGGTVAVYNSHLYLTNGGTVFPCIKSAVNPFPASGDFALQFDITWTDIGNYGNGLWVSNGLFSPEGWLISEDVLDEANASDVNMLQVWADATGVYVDFFGKRVNMVDAIWRPGGISATETLVFRLEYTNGVYAIFLNNRPLASQASTMRPDTIAFGHPPTYYVPLHGVGHWSSFKIDSIVMMMPTSLTLETSATSTDIGLAININGTLNR